MGEELTIFMAEGGWSKNFVIGDSDGNQIGSVEYPKSGNSTKITYRDDAHYSFQRRDTMIDLQYDFIDEDKVRAGSSEEDGRIATSTLVHPMGTGLLSERQSEHRSWTKIDFSGQSFHLREDAMTRVTGFTGTLYGAQFRLLQCDSSGVEGEVLGKIVSAKSLSTDFYLTSDGNVPLPLRLFCFVLAIDRLRSPID